MLSRNGFAIAMTFRHWSPLPSPPAFAGKSCAAAVSSVGVLVFVVWRPPRQLWRGPADEPLFPSRPPGAPTVSPSLHRARHREESTRRRQQRGPSEVAEVPARSASVVHCPSGSSIGVGVSTPLLTDCAVCFPRGSGLSISVPVRRRASDIGVDEDRTARAFPRGVPVRLWARFGRAVSACPEEDGPLGPGGRQGSSGGVGRFRGLRQVGRLFR